MFVLGRFCRKAALILKQLQNDGFHNVTHLHGLDARQVWRFSLAGLFGPELHGRRLDAQHTRSLRGPNGLTAFLHVKL